MYLTIISERTFQLDCVWNLVKKKSMNTSYLVRLLMCSLKKILYFVYTPACTYSTVQKREFFLAG